MKYHLAQVLGTCALLMKRDSAIVDTEGPEHMTVQVQVCRIKQLFEEALSLWRCIFRIAFIAYE